MNKRPRLVVVFRALLAAIAASAGILVGGGGCIAHEPTYGVERRIVLEAKRREVWAVAPALNLSGYGGIDPLIHADLVYGQLQQVRGLTVIPVNRVAEVYASLNIDRVQTEEQAAVVCDLLGADGLVVPTITAYDPYVPPKLGASLQLLGKPASWARPASVDPRQLVRQASPGETESLPGARRGGGSTAGGGAIQSVGMYDAANGSVREALLTYAAGRSDPLGPMGPKEYVASMDRYCGFVYHELIIGLLNKASQRRS